MTLGEHLIDAPADAPPFRVVDESFAGQVINRDRRFSGKVMVMRDDEGEVVRAEREHVDVGEILARERDESDIEPTLLHRPDQLGGSARFDSHLDLDLRSAGAVRDQYLVERAEGEGLEDPEANGAAHPSFDIGDRVLCLVKGPQHLSGFDEQNLPGLGQRDGMPGSLEQLRVQRSFEGAHRRR